MRRMGIAALGPKPRTRKPAPGHKIFPYLREPDHRATEPSLGGGHHLFADRARLSLSRGGDRLVEPGSVELAAVEHHGRGVLRFRARGSAGALRHTGDFQHRPGQPVHQHCIYRLLAAAGVKISMDGRGRWLDNVFVERLWRSLKHEDVYLKGYADGTEAKAGIGAWFAFYNSTRPHQALGNRAPMAVWREGTTGDLGKTAVDMTLRLDNARALPTYPQPPPQQKMVSTR